MPDFFTPNTTLGVCNIHLSSGEDIIGDVYEKDTELHGGRAAYIVKKPVLPNVRAAQDGNGQPTFHVGLLPLRPYFENVDSVEVFIAHVMFIVPVNKQMEKLYREFVSSIALVDASQMPRNGGGPGSLIR